MGQKLHFVNPALRPPSWKNGGHIVFHEKYHISVFNEDKFKILSRYDRALHRGAAV